MIGRGDTQILGRHALEDTLTTFSNWGRRHVFRAARVGAAPEVWLG
jgi:hypothetical protein